MPAKHQCPHCKGEKEFRHWGPYAWSSDDPDSPDAGRFEVTICWTCGGTGEISPVALACYRARGGPEPVPFKGYA